MGQAARRGSPPSALADALRLQERLSRLLERALARTRPPARTARGAGAPAVDLFETPRAFELRADLAGLVPASFEIALAPRAIALSGRLSGALRGSRRFARRIALPGEIDPAGARGSLRRGVLSLVVPKRRPLRLVTKAPRSARKGASRD